MGRILTIMDGWPNALFLSASLSALAFWPPPTEGSIRCYCNIERCAITGYTCISHANRCFSKLFNSNKSGGSGVADVHGCLDLLPERQRGLCDGYRSGDLVKASESGDALIMCCLDDLCNYKANQDALVDVAKVNISLGAERTSPIAHPRSTNAGGGPGAESHSEGLGWNVDGSQNGSRGSTSDAWFMAAVVAVPIVGGLILVVLVLVAVRMLQYDSRRAARERSVAKARLFIDRHFAGSGYRLYGNVCNEPQCRCRGDSAVTQISYWDGDNCSNCSTSDFATDCGVVGSVECRALDRDVSTAVSLNDRLEQTTKRDRLSEDSRPIPEFV